jgi:RHS repeat-associated protein
VFFDNLQVTHTRGPILEETHYYPFGLVMAGISSKALEFDEPENKMKYNGIEKENDLGIEVYDAQFRELDGQIGRWWQIDPVTDGYENISPYASMYNNPIIYSDPLGNEGQNCCWFTFDKEAFMDGVRWFNNHLNPLTPVVELVTGKSMDSDLKTDKPRLNTLYEGMAPSRAPLGAGRGPKLSSAEQLKLNAERGVQSEKFTLKQEGLEKNTTPVTVTDSKTGKKVTTIPDSYTADGGTVEVKDAKKLSDSKQLRAQSQVSAQNGQKGTIITGASTGVSKTLRKRMIIETRDHLGPQK